MFLKKELYFLEFGVLFGRNWFEDCQDKYDLVLIITDTANIADIADLGRQ